MPLLDSRLIQAIQDNHARQLANFRVGDVKGVPPVDRLPIEELDGVLDWISANSAAVKDAQNNLCSSTSPDTPNWNVIFFTIAESAAVYLRKEDDIVSAIEAAQAGDFGTATEFIKKSQESINSVAEKLNCTYVQLCDFANQSPEGYWLHSGAFCGMFVSKDASHPFVGITFKGSVNYREWITDADWKPSDPLVAGAAYGSQIHRGFNAGLFGTYSPDNLTAFDYIIKQLDSVSTSVDGHTMHFTGHSLGGAYASLTFGEFLRRKLDQPSVQFQKYIFGDMYTFGAPRVCLPPFFTYVNAHNIPTSATYLFRIVNNNDPVPTIPPPTTGGLTQYPYMHVGGAYKLLPDTKPQKMADEPPQVDPSAITYPWKYADHQLASYYENWRNAPHA